MQNMMQQNSICLIVTSLGRTQPQAVMNIMEEQQQITSAAGFAANFGTIVNTTVAVSTVIFAA